ncbi:unnamed protein product [Schistocephalus solidus]|uniref:DUF727 domain-containing protein n=1 Tax=Schistocephalus solidus TaxID=70667 RepID=A0A183TC59_SCHSO|nr:unnamed protein product [Schistocephalus solidus]
MKFPPLHFATDPENKLCTVEAEAAVTETAFAVRDIRISEALPFNESLAYLNLTTLEGESLCVQINANGFQPIGVRPPMFSIWYGTASQITCPPYAAQ